MDLRIVCRLVGVDILYNAQLERVLNETDALDKDIARVLRQRVVSCTFMDALGSVLNLLKFME